MDAERFRRVETLFHRALELQPTARVLLLDSECGTDHELRAEVERLIDSDAREGGGDLLSRIEARALNAGPDPLLGRKLGAYTLTERIAAGGMGVVYRGRRADGLYEADVAIKLIRAECVTSWMLRRFEFERRTLAALQHPSIARVLDAGATEEGVPYLVMEFVHGERIDRYCARERLTVPARLRLFLEVCRAVHFAHQKLVVHCDLKPANILIDERGAPRLLDFGIARLLDDEPDVSHSAEVAPRTLTRVLTPEYASPEQLAGGAITTAIDVYALGVLLYELLTGQRPIESESRSPAEWERLIREQPAERPSSRVVRTLDAARTSALKQEFQSAPPALRRALRGDLDRIVLMALRKEPERRYASVQEFAEDIERHLAGQPVRARPDSLAYRAWSFARRNRVAVVGAVAVLAALSIGLIAARRGEARATLEARHARMEAESFQSLADFLMDAFLPTQPAQDLAWQTRARERIVAQAARVERQFADSDHVRANLLDALGQVSARLDLVDDAQALSARAAQIREQQFGERSLEHASSLRSLGQLAYQRGDFALAEKLLRRALGIQREFASDPHADVASSANDLAAALRNLGRADEAEALHLEALALRRASGPDWLSVAESLNNLAAVHQAGARSELAIGELREALQLRESILGGEHELTLQTVSNLAIALWMAGEREEARALMRRAEHGYRALRGDGEDALGHTLANLSDMQLADKDLDGAAQSLDAALALQTKRLGPVHPLVATTLAKLAVLQHARGCDELARERWNEALRIRRAAPQLARELAVALYGYGVFLRDVDECESARPLLEESLVLHRAQMPHDLLALARAEFVLALCLRRPRESEAAREHLRESLCLFDAHPNPPVEERARVERALAALERAIAR